MGSDTWVGINELSGYGLPDWYGVRVGGQAGTAMRLCCRYQNVAKGAYYKGQLYAPSITTIKDGKFVNVSVSFKYGGNSSTSKAKTLLYFGINTLNPLVNPDDADLISGVINGAGYGNQKPATLSPMVIEGQELSRSSSYTSFEGTKTVVINEMDNFMRMAWIISTTHSALFTNSNSFMYIDDITVKIAGNN